MALFASTIVAIPRVWIALPNYPDLWYLAHTATSLLVGPPQLARRRAGEKLNSFLRLELGLRRPPTPTTIPTTLKNLLTSPRAAHTVPQKKMLSAKKGAAATITLDTLSKLCKHELVHFFDAKINLSFNFSVCEDQQVISQTQVRLNASGEDAK